MNVSITNGMEDFVREQVQSGEFPSEDAVVEAALKCFRDQKSRAFEALVDHDLIEYAEHEGDPRVTLDEVLRATSTIPGSMATAIIEDERADRF
jgi:putative addiction module CopG family antidote